MRRRLFFSLLTRPAHGGFALFGLKIGVQAFAAAIFTIVVVSVVIGRVFRELFGVLNLSAL